MALLLKLLTVSTLGGTPTGQKHVLGCSIPFDPFDVFRWLEGLGVVPLDPGRNSMQNRGGFTSGDPAATLCVQKIRKHVVLFK